MWQRGRIQCICNVVAARTSLPEHRRDDSCIMVNTCARPNQQQLWSIRRVQASDRRHVHVLFRHRALLAAIDSDITHQLREDCACSV